MIDLSQFNTTTTVTPNRRTALNNYAQRLVAPQDDSTSCG